MKHPPTGEPAGVRYLPELSPSPAALNFLRRSAYRGARPNRRALESRCNCLWSRDALTLIRRVFGEGADAYQIVTLFSGNSFGFVRCNDVSRACLGRRFRLDRKRRSLSLREVHVPRGTCPDQNRMPFHKRKSAQIPDPNLDQACHRFGSPLAGNLYPDRAFRPQTEKPEETKAFAFRFFRSASSRRLLDRMHNSDTLFGLWQTHCQMRCSFYRE